MYSEKIKEDVQNKFRDKFGDLKTIDLQVYDKEIETHPMTIDEIIDEMEPYKAKHIVISGGEPLLQIQRLILLVEHLSTKGFDFEIETNGTIDPTPLRRENVRFNVSPKLDNSLNDRSKRYIPEILNKYLTTDSIFKFVVSTVSDLDEIEQIIIAVGIPHSRVYLMPEGKTTDELRQKSSWIIDVCKARNYNYTHRLHIELFDNTRGV